MQLSQFPISNASLNVTDAQYKLLAIVTSYSVAFEVLAVAYTHSLLAGHTRCLLV